MTDTERRGSCERTEQKEVFRHVFFYNHMKFRIQARLCLAIYDCEARIVLYFSRYQTTGMRKI